MLGLFLIYFLGKSFYTLAKEYGQKTWKYAILGVVSYYAGTFIAGIFLVILIELFYAGGIETFNEYLLNFIALPFGILSAFLMYKFLEKRLKGETPRKLSDSTILDDEML